MANFNEATKIPKGLLLAALAALTLALLFGIRFFMSDDTSAGVFQQEGKQELFKDELQRPPGGNPAARSEAGSGGGLDMFSKTNAGYYGEEESTGTAQAPAAGAPAAKKAAAPAARKAAAAKPKATVIPRMKRSSFGGVSPTNVAPGGAGQGMPDISGMLKQAQQRTGQPAQDNGD